MFFFFPIFPETVQTPIYLTYHCIVMTRLKVYNHANANAYV